MGRGLASEREGGRGECMVEGGSQRHSPEDTDGKG